MSQSFHTFVVVLFWIIFPRTGLGAAVIDHSSHLLVLACAPSSTTHHLAGHSGIEMSTQILNTFLTVLCWSGCVASSGTALFHELFVAVAAHLHHSAAHSCRQLASKHISEAAFNVFSRCWSCLLFTRNGAAMLHSSSGTSRVAEIVSSCHFAAHSTVSGDTFEALVAVFF